MFVTTLYLYYERLGLLLNKRDQCPLLDIGLPVAFSRSLSSAHLAFSYCWQALGFRSSGHLVSYFTIGLHALPSSTDVEFVSFCSSLTLAVVFWHTPCLKENLHPLTLAKINVLTKILKHIHVNFLGDKFLCKINK